jgi:hypothetical protein
MLRFKPVLAFLLLGVWGGDPEGKVLSGWVYFDGKEATACASKLEAEGMECLNKDVPQ